MFDANVTNVRTVTVANSQQEFHYKARSRWNNQARIHWPIVSIAVRNVIVYVRVSQCTGTMKTKKRKEIKWNLETLARARTILTNVICIEFSADLAVRLLYLFSICSIDKHLLARRRFYLNFMEKKKKNISKQIDCIHLIQIFKKSKKNQTLDKNGIWTGPKSLKNLYELQQNFRRNK